MFTSLLKILPMPASQLRIAECEQAGKKEADASPIIGKQASPQRATGSEQESYRKLCLGGLSL